MPPGSRPTHPPHEDPGFTFRVYQRAVKRRERLSPVYLAAFDHPLEWAEMGRIESESPAARSITPIDPRAETCIAKP
jgi:hypothetical protein